MNKSYFVLNNKFCKLSDKTLKNINNILYLEYNLNLYIHILYYKYHQYDMFIIKNSNLANRFATINNFKIQVYADENNECDNSFYKIIN